MHATRHRSVAGAGLGVVCLVVLASVRAGAEPACPRCEPPATVGHLEQKKIKEPSGLVASAVHDGIYFTHDDSGHKPRFFALDGEGHDRGIFVVDGAENIDWEDVARGPCGAESCLFFGDIGEGKKTRTWYTIYRVKEPKELGGEKTHVTADALPFRYPDGPHDAETLLVHPDTGAIWVITKVKHGRAGIYAMPEPLTPGTMAVLKKVGEVLLPEEDRKITAGDIQPEGKSVLIRTYANVWLYPIAKGESVPDALGKAPCKLPVAREVQGEAIAWLRSGRGYITLSEEPGAALHRVECASP